MNEDRIVKYKENTQRIFEEAVEAVCEEIMRSKELRKMLKTGLARKLAKQMAREDLPKRSTKKEIDEIYKIANQSALSQTVRACVGAILRRLCRDCREHGNGIVTFARFEEIIRESNRNGFAKQHGLYRNDAKSAISAVRLVFAEKDFFSHRRELSCNDERYAIKIVAEKGFNVAYLGTFTDKSID